MQTWNHNNPPTYYKQTLTARHVLHPVSVNLQNESTNARQHTGMTPLRFRWSRSDGPHGKLPKQSIKLSATENIHFPNRLRSADLFLRHTDSISGCSKFTESDRRARANRDTFFEEISKYSPIPPKYILNMDSRDYSQLSSSERINRFSYVTFRRFSMTNPKSHLKQFTKHANL